MTDSLQGHKIKTPGLQPRTSQKTKRVIWRQVIFMRRLKSLGISSRTKIDHSEGVVQRGSQGCHPIAYENPAITVLNGRGAFHDGAGAAPEWGTSAALPR